MDGKQKQGNETEEDPYEFHPEEETEGATRKRILEEKQLFYKSKQIRRNKKVDQVGRVSYKQKRGEIVLNKRRQKTCPICLKVNKQLIRHIKTTHSDLDGVVLSEACKIAKVRQSDRRPGKVTCPICGTMRKNLRSHLIKEHTVGKNHPKVLKELTASKPASAIPKVTNNSVAQWVKDYERSHFNRFDGARLSSKDSTRRKQIVHKLAVVGRMLDFLANRTADCSVEGALKVCRGGGNAFCFCKKWGFF